MKNEVIKKPGLYIVATPIGNLRDISLRALDVLAAADLILCEDTRHAMKLLQSYSINSKLESYHEYNAQRKRPAILQKLQSGHIVALISDAGTPLISDPGYKLVAEAAAINIDITPIPGACAAIAALSASALPTDRFYFSGFLPTKSKARKQQLRTLVNIDACLVIYESANRLAATLTDMAAIFAKDSPVVIAREITKKFEEFRRGCLQEMADHYTTAEKIKGEIVILLHNSPCKNIVCDADIDKLLLKAMLLHGSVKQAAAHVAEITEMPKKDLYKRALQLKL